MKRQNFVQWLNEDDKKKFTIVIGDTGGIPSGLNPSDDDMEEIPDEDDDVTLAEPDDEELPLKMPKLEPLDLSIGGINMGAELEKMWKPLTTGKTRAKSKPKAKVKPKAKKKKRGVMILDFHEWMKLNEVVATPPPPPRKQVQSEQGKLVGGNKSGYLIYQKMGRLPNDPSRQVRDLFYVYSPGITSMHLGIFADLDTAKFFMDKQAGWATQQQTPQGPPPPPPPPPRKAGI